MGRQLSWSKCIPRERFVKMGSTFQTKRIFEFHFLSFRTIVMG